MEGARQFQHALACKMLRQEKMPTPPLFFRRKPPRDRPVFSQFINQDRLHSARLINERHEAHDAKA